MKIIISPTKTMKRKNFVTTKTKPIFLKESNDLRSIMKSYSQEDLQHRLKISEKLSATVFSYYHDEQQPIQAINLYEGASFKAMSLADWSIDDFEFLQDNLYIMSAMYGMLKPYDAILEYRLDYLTKLDVNLYDYWLPSINDVLNKESLILNLASQEFTKMLNHPNMINVVFLDEQERNLSTQAKQARGDIVQYIIKHKITDPEELKAYHNLGYQYIEAKSDQNNLLFIKQKAPR